MQVRSDTGVDKQVSAAVVAMALRGEQRKESADRPVEEHQCLDVSIEVDGDDWAYCKSDN
ncbi:hypothetical protein HBA55_21320 [Pseudomaricurvus alkylphenolicus]|jgi:hypothetical protein|uniref:hypothetical protein n=1 Tax=Pseudomaricurvus alkylphenolicus TaxID=1306991 RepID=UPI00141F0301|nr:hypothetical protein [Pseudomaricurvus alkylphenolicus]NIB42161.1 hypothetical protein [Pseudomaricurvus alkylphenolicus]